jgi:hypothetical protein
VRWRGAQGRPEPLRAEPRTRSRTYRARWTTRILNSLVSSDTLWLLCTAGQGLSWRSRASSSRSAGHLVRLCRDCSSPARRRSPSWRTTGRGSPGLHARVTLSVQASRFTLSRPGRRRPSASRAAVSSTTTWDDSPSLARACPGS